MTTVLAQSRSTLRTAAGPDKAALRPATLPAQPVTPASPLLKARKLPSVAARAEQSTSSEDQRTTEVLKEAEALEGLTPDQQKDMIQIFNFLVQNAGSKARVDRSISLKRLVETYQVLIWRPAELLNGRMAMIGFTAGALRQALYGETVWTQNFKLGGFAYLMAYGIVLLAGQLNRISGSPRQGVGPFTQTAELINGRAAMVGYAILAYIGYNQDLSRQIFAIASQLARMQMPNINA